MARHSKKKMILFLLLMPSLYSCNFGPPSSFSSASQKNSQQSLKFLLEPKEILAAGEFQSLNLILKNGDKSIEPDESDVTWISSDEKVAFVNQFGLVAARKPGKVKIKAYLRENLDIFSEFDLQVIGKQDVKSITINPKNVVIQLGDEKQLTAVVELGDGTFNGNVSWFSEDSRIVQVNESGKIRATNLGIASIIAAYSPDTGSRVSVKVEVVKELKVDQTVANPYPKPSLSTSINSSPSPLNAAPSQVPTPQISSSPDLQNSIPSSTPIPQTISTHLNPIPSSSSTPIASTQPTITPLSTPAPPSGLSVSGVTSSSFNISWGSVSNANSYNVYKDNILLIGSLAVTNYTVTGLNPNTNYAMQVSATNSSGESFKSSLLSITTQTQIASLIVSTLAGNGDGINGIGGGFADGVGTNAQFNSPSRVAVDSSGNAFVADGKNHRIRKITPSGMVTTFAGNGNPGFADGVGTSAQFNYPVGVAVDKNGNIYVADQKNHRIRMITSDGIVSTLAGNGTSGFADGSGETAQFNNPKDVAVDNNGNVYVADVANYRIRKITPVGIASTLAGNGTYGYVDGTGSSAQFLSPIGVAVDSNGYVYVTDSSRIRKITPGGGVSTLAGSSESAYVDGTGIAARFGNPQGLAVDSSGNIFVADSYNQRIRKITSGGIVSTLAGSTYGYADGSGLIAQFYTPLGVAVRTSGIIYVTEQDNHRVRKILMSP